VTLSAMVPAIGVERRRLGTCMRIRRIGEVSLASTGERNSSGTQLTGVTRAGGRCYRDRRGVDWSGGVAIGRRKGEGRLPCSDRDLILRLHAWRNLPLGEPNREGGSNRANVGWLGVA
jgi:hypothetical protein